MSGSKYYLFPPRTAQNISYEYVSIRKAKEHPHSFLQEANWKIPLYVYSHFHSKLLTN